MTGRVLKKELVNIKNSPLHEEDRSGSPEANFRDKEGRQDDCPKLTSAAERGDLVATKDALVKGTAAGCRDYNGMTPLQILARNPACTVARMRGS